MNTSTIPADPIATPPPLHGFRGERSGAFLKPRGLTVAISRESGARGGSIAQRVAQSLGWQVFDQERLDDLVRDEAARQSFFADIPEAAQDWANDQLDRLIRDLRILPGSETAEIARLILLVAARGEAILVGRGAGFLLPAETTVHVRIVAPLDDRIAYMSQWLRLSRDEAAVEVRNRDDRRAAFLSHVFPREPGELYRYDLILNSSRLGEDASAEIIVRAVQSKLPTGEECDPFMPDVV